MKYDCKDPHSRELIENKKFCNQYMAIMCGNIVEDTFIYMDGAWFDLYLRLFAHLNELQY